MNLGRQVVRLPAITLRPVAGSVARARTMTPWADRADGPLEVPVGHHLLAQRRAGEILAHAGSVPSGQDQAVEVVRLDLAPGDRIAELRRPDELLVESPRLGVCSEATEEHAAKQSRIT